MPRPIPEAIYERDGIAIYHGDCHDIVRRLAPEADLVLTDPPYGMGWNTDSTRFSGGKRNRGDGRWNGNSTC